MENTNLIIGSTGSGKTRGYMFNEITKVINNGKNLFIWDNKKEYYNNFYDDLLKNNYDIKIVNGDEPDNSNGFNILSYPYKLYKNGEIDKSLKLVQNVGDAMINSTGDSADFWNNSARDLFCSLILILFKEGKEEEINFYSIVKILSMIDVSEKGVIESLRRYLSKLDVTDPIYSLGSGSIFAPIETRGGIFTTLKLALSSYIFRPKMLDLLSINDGVLDCPDKTAIFFVGKDKSGSLGVVLLEQFLYSIIDKDESVLVFDNINKLPKIPNINDLVEYARESNVISYFVANNYDELVSMYGKYVFEGVKNRKVIENMDVTINNKKGVMPKLTTDEKIICDFEFLN